MALEPGPDPGRPSWPFPKPAMPLPACFSRHERTCVPFKNKIIQEFPGGLTVKDSTLLEFSWWRVGNESD